MALGLYLHSEVQICVSDALSISSCFQSLLGCLRFSCSYCFFLFLFHSLPSEKRLAESEKEKEMRQEQDKEYHRQKRRQPSKDWKQELIDKASLTHICTSECRYRPKASMVLVKENMFTSKQGTDKNVHNLILIFDLISC